MDLPDAGRPLPEPPVPGEPPSLVELVRRGTLDAELAALVWLLIEGRIPVIVAAPDDVVERGTGGDILAGILGSIRHDARVLANEVRAPLAVRDARAIVHGDQLGGVAAGDSLEAVRASLGRPPAGLTEDELTFLGCVLVLGEGPPPEVAAADPSMEPARPVRVVAAHYVRPLARDRHGHAQFLGPAVLATWDPERQTWEHFAWGVLPEIALRLGRRMGDLEADLHHRRDDLGGLAAAGVTSLREVRQLIEGYRVAYGQDRKSVV